MPKRDTVTQRLRTLLGNSPELRPLATQAQTLAAMQRVFASVAPAWLAQSCTVVGWKFGTLTLSTGTPSAAAKLRQLAPELVVLMQNKGSEVSGIRVKVQVSAVQPTTYRRPRPLSDAARDALANLGSELEDSPLKRALAKMAEKAKSR